MTRDDRLIHKWFLATAASAFVFTAIPGIDLATSRLFWDGAVFPVAEDPLMQVLREAAWILSMVVALAAIVGTVVAGVTGRPVAQVPGKLWVFILGLYLLGPGLIVNGILKSNWGRARPDQVEAFGGSRVFSVALWPTDQCLSNCSFSSGEAASAAALGVALVVLVRHLRPRVVGLGIAAAVTVTVLGGGLRIAFGRHFLSDVVFSWLIVAGVAIFLDRLILRRPSPARAGRRNTV